MIQSTRGLFLLAVLVAFVSLVMLFPARVAYRWAAPTAIAMSGIHGTVWRGKADALAAGGLVMQEVHWKFRPLRLLTGAMSYRVDGAFQSGFLQGHVALGIGGDLTVSELRATVPLAPFAQTLRVSGLKGEASARFGRVVIRDGFPIAAKGVVDVNNLVAPKLSRESIGGYRAEFFTQDDGISASIEDTDGVLDLAGSLRLNSDRSYQFIGQILPKPQTPASVRQQIQYLGNPNERGQYELRIEGRL